MSDQASKDVDIAKQIAEIENILAWFDSEEVDISEALKKYEKGLASISELEEYLKAAKVKVTKINKKFEK